MTAPRSRFKWIWSALMMANINYSLVIITPAENHENGDVGFVTDDYIAAAGVRSRFGQNAIIASDNISQSSEMNLF